MNSPTLQDLLKAQIKTWRSLAEVSHAASEKAKATGNVNDSLIHEALAHARSACAQNLENLLREQGL